MWELIDLGLAQILPMFDDETGAEPKIVSASIADPFLLLLRDDASIYVAQSGSDNELEELEKIDDVILTTKWLSGCLYTDTSGMFASIQTDKGLREGENVMMFLLSADGSLFVSSRNFIALIKAHNCRCMLYRISQNQYIRLKGSASSLQQSLPSML